MLNPTIRQHSRLLHSALHSDCRPLHPSRCRQSIAKIPDAHCELRSGRRRRVAWVSVVASDAARSIRPPAPRADEQQPSRMARGIPYCGAAAGGTALSQLVSCAADNRTSSVHSWIGILVVQPGDVVVHHLIQRPQHCDRYPSLHSQRVKVALQLACCGTVAPNVESSPVHKILFLHRVPFVVNARCARLSSSTSEGSACVRPEEENQ
jgi:hypothetical protein